MTYVIRHVTDGVLETRKGRNKVLSEEASLKHNLGKTSGMKGSKLTLTAYSSGISSAVNLGIHSTDHQRQWDFVAAKPSDIKKLDETKHEYQDTMRGLKLGRPLAA